MIPVAINMRRGDKRHRKCQTMTRGHGEHGHGDEARDLGKKPMALPVLLAVAVCGSPLREAAAGRSMLLWATHFSPMGTDHISKAITQKHCFILWRTLFLRGSGPKIVISEAFSLYC